MVALVAITLYWGMRVLLSSLTYDAQDELVGIVQGDNAELGEQRFCLRLEDTPPKHCAVQKYAMEIYRC